MTPDELDPLTDKILEAIKAVTLDVNIAFALVFSVKNAEEDEFRELYGVAANVDQADTHALLEKVLNAEQERLEEPRTLN